MNREFDIWIARDPDDEVDGPEGSLNLFLGEPTLKGSIYIARNGAWFQIPHELFKEVLPGQCFRARVVPEVTG